MQRQSTYTRTPRLWKCHALVVTAKQTIKIEHGATSRLPFLRCRRIDSTGPHVNGGTFSAIGGICSPSRNVFGIKTSAAERLTLVSIFSDNLSRKKLAKGTRSALDGALKATSRNAYSEQYRTLARCDTSGRARAGTDVGVPARITSLARRYTNVPTSSGLEVST